jgi:hypothetical protein
MFMYYAAHLTDDAHHGKNASRIHYDADDGMYLEAMRDLKFVIGNAGMQMLRGPMFSNMIKSGRIRRGCFFLSELSESELRERLFFGSAIPSVRALNEREPEAAIDRGGMSGPLRKGVARLHTAYRERVAELTGCELRPMDASSLKRKLVRPAAFSASVVQSALQGEHVPKLAVPKRPRGGYAEGVPVPWYHQPMPEVEPIVEPIVEPMPEPGVAM